MMAYAPAPVGAATLRTARDPGVPRTGL